MTLSIGYYNTDTSTSMPLPRAKITGSIYNTITGNTVGSYSGFTDDNGLFSLSCTPGLGYQYQGAINLDNVDAKVIHNGSTYAGGFETAVCGQVNSFNMTSVRSRVYDNIQRTIPASRSLLGVSRAKITIEIRDPTQSLNNNQYLASTDVITIMASGGNAAIWGVFGSFIVAHEYGHAVHQKALGGNVVPGFCPDPHTVWGSSNLQCAYSEGFANYHAVATRGSAVGHFSSEQESNILGDGRDGSVVEGAVAAFFLDLTDPINLAEPLGTHDSIQYSGSYIGNIVKSCKVGVSSLSRATGVDHLTYCFERLIDPLITGSSVYFTTRGSDPTQFSETATEPTSWNRLKIRRLWQCNLYIDGCG